MQLLFIGKTQVALTQLLILFQETPITILAWQTILCFATKLKQWEVTHHRVLFFQF